MQTGVNRNGTTHAVKATFLAMTDIVGLVPTDMANFYIRPTSTSKIIDGQTSYMTVQFGHDSKPTTFTRPVKLSVS